MFRSSTWLIVTVIVVILGYRYLKCDPVIFPRMRLKYDVIVVAIVKIVNAVPSQVPCILKSRLPERIEDQVFSTVEWYLKGGERAAKFYSKHPGRHTGRHSPLQMLRYPSCKMFRLFLPLTVIPGLISASPTSVQSRDKYWHPKLIVRYLGDGSGHYVFIKLWNLMTLQISINTPQIRL